MKNSCRCFWVPFCGFRRFSCPFFLEHHHVVLSESLQGSSHICISVKLDLFWCLARDQKSPWQRKNVAKYLWKRDLARNLFHKQHVYHLKSINMQQSFHLGRLATLYRERIINVNRNLHQVVKFLSAEIKTAFVLDQVKFLSDYSGIEFANEIHVWHKEIIIINRSPKI